MERENNYSGLKKIVAGIAIVGAGIASSFHAVADTIYYGGSVKGKTNPAYIVFDAVKVESKYHKQLPANNDPSYDKILGKRNDSVDNATTNVAQEKGYDVVVEKNDPPIKGPDISDLVKAKIKENEGQK